jgi:hypothetical protein
MGWEFTRLGRINAPEAHQTFTRRVSGGLVRLWRIQYSYSLSEGILLYGTNNK